MEKDVKGIVIRQTNTAGNRRILTLFTKKYGKISAGTSINPGGKSKSALATQPFTYGRYDLYKGRESFNINAAESFMNFYGVGENIEKYACGSYALELCDKLLPENEPAPELFDLLVSLLLMMEKRKKDPFTLLNVFKWKVVQLYGVMPRLDICAVCGESAGKSGGDDQTLVFSVRHGGLVCGNCMSNVQDGQGIFRIGRDVVDVIRFIEKRSINTFEKLSLKEEYLTKSEGILKMYIAEHLGVADLKSEAFLTEDK